MQKAPKKLQDSKIASLKDSLQKANEKLKIWEVLEIRGIQYNERSICKLTK